MKDPKKPAVSSRVMAILAALILPTLIALLIIGVVTDNEVLGIAALLVIALPVCIGMLVAVCMIVYHSSVESMERRREEREKRRSRSNKEGDKTAPFGKVRQDRTDCGPGAGSCDGDHR